MRKNRLVPLVIALAAGQAGAQDDVCATATPIAGTGSFPFSTIGMTDSGLIASCNDVFSADGWFAWTPATSGNYQLSVCSASHDIVLAAYDACGGAELGCDDGFASGVGTCSGTANDVLITLGSLVGGTTYLIQLDGWNGNTGTGSLDIVMLASGPVNDECASATSIAGTGSFAFTTFGATNSGLIADCNGTSSADVWLEWTPTTSDNYRLTVCNATYDIVMAAYDACGGTQLGCSDGFASGFGACAGTSRDVAINLPGLVGGTAYLIQLDGFDGLTGSGVLDIAIGSPPPTNDDCSSATPIGGTGSFPFSTFGASGGGQPSTCSSGASADAWFAWTPATSGNYQVSVCSASYDIVLAVFDACGGMQIGCDDGGAVGVGTCSGSVSDVVVNLPGSIAGTTYLIQVEGWGAATGTGTLDINTYSLPTNDDCSGATPISGTGTFAVSNLNATSGTVATCAVGPSTDVWYEWTSGASLDYRFQVCGAPFDEVLALFDACGGVQLGCNDFGGCGGGGMFDVEIDLYGLLPGTPYWIQFDGWNGGTGTAVLDITALSAPPITGTSYCLSVINSTGAASVMSASGSGSLSAGDLVITANNLPSQPGIFIAGPDTYQMAAFDGFLCINPVGLQRFLNTSSPTSGVITEVVDYASSAAGGLNVVAGSAYHFQRWNRDPDAGGTGANFSDGLAVDIVP